MTLFNLIALRTKIIQIYFKQNRQDFPLFEQQHQQKSLVDALYKASFFVYFIFLLLSLFLSLLTQTFNVPSGKEPKIRDNVSLLSFITFWWTNELISEGYKKDLCVDDLWPLDYKKRSDYLTRKFESEWLRRADSYLRQIDFVDDDSDHQVQNKITRIRKADEKGDEEETISLKEVNLNKESTLIKVKSERKKDSKPSLVIALLKCFGFEYSLGILIKFFHDLLGFAKPILLEYSNLFHHSLFNSIFN